MYEQVADALRAAIRSGQLGDGSLFRPRLSRRSGTASTQQRLDAMELLRVEGLVFTEHGRGSFVQARRPLRRLSPPHVLQGAPG